MFGFGTELESDEQQTKLVAIFNSLRRNAASTEDKREAMEKLKALKKNSLNLAWERFSSTHH